MRRARVVEDGGGLFTARDLRKCVITAATPAC